MLRVYPLDIGAETAYAEEWCEKRNPAFGDFSDLGGDCTGFVSQCIYAGGAVMNYTPDTGWYYRSLSDRAAAWSGVEYFYRFIISNRGRGPFGYTVPLSAAAPGDVIQLCSGNGCYHSLFVTEVTNGVPYVSAHSDDSCRRPLTDYVYSAARCLRIRQYRK